MTSHPDRLEILRRLENRVDEWVGDFAQTVFRFVKPRYSSATEMFAGRGPVYANGRWLVQCPKLACYTSLFAETALAEALAANRYYGFPDERSAPLVFVTASAQMKRILDLRKGSTRQRLRLSADTIVATDWRRENLRGREAITQAWGWALQEAGVEGFLCPSAALSGGENLIVFPEHLRPASHLRILREVDWPR